MNLSKLKQIRAVVFDMDGLMFDSERYVKMSWTIAGEKLGYGPLGEHIGETLGLNRKDREIYFKERYGRDFPFEEFLDLYRDVYYELCGDQGVPAKEGLHEILEVLKSRGIKMGVATSSSQEHAFANLRREHITGYFQAVVTGNMIRHGKPEPDIYLEACKRLQENPCHVMALEDALNGIRAAHRAGMMPVMIPDLVTDSRSVDDILFGKCNSLSELAEIFKAIEQG